MKGKYLYAGTVAAAVTAALGLTQPDASRSEEDAQNPCLSGRYKLPEAFAKLSQPINKSSV